MSDVSVPRARMARSGRVLVVEDEEAVRRACVRVLQNAGFAVDAVADGAMVAAAFAAQDFDLVITDMALPSTNGIEVLKAVRDKDPDLPVVLMTGGDDFMSAVKAVEHGASRYLLKPFSAGTLVGAAEQGLALRHLARARRRALDHYQTVAQQEGVRAELNARFEQAMASLYMVYQPIVRWSTRQVFAYEALVRTEERTLRFPTDLLAAAESLGRLTDLGRATRRCVAATGLASAPSVPTFVNLHPRDIEDDDLLSPDAPLSGVASRIVLEITERASLTPRRSVQKRLGALRALGYRLAVDDLGKGYSSLAAVAQIEPDVVKLDMSLTRRLDEEPTKRRLFESMLAFCRDMGSLAVAEGVETPAERDALLALGCDLMQGNLFAKPARGFPPVLWSSQNQLSRRVRGGHVSAAGKLARGA